MKIPKDRHIHLAQDLSASMKEVINENLFDISIWADEAMRKQFPEDHHEMYFYKVGLVRAVLLGMVGFYIADTIKKEHVDDFIQGFVAELKDNAKNTGLF